MRILIVEDEFNLADIIKDRLKKEKYIVDIANDGNIGLEKALSGLYDLIILDVMLPYKNGFEILKEIRSENIDVEVIMLTAKAELEDKLDGFSKGADDYVTKPFHLEELVARINARLKKTGSSKEKDYLEYGNLRLNLKESSIMCIDTGEAIEISCKEFLILEYMLRNKNQVISKDQLYTKIWGAYNELESNNLEAYLSFIRKKINIIDANIHIKAIRGLGYKLEVKNE